MGLTQVNTSSHLGQSYHVDRNNITFLFSEWRIREQTIGIVMASELDFDNVTCVWSCTCMHHKGFLET